jgi:hypothetical protein
MSDIPNPFLLEAATKRGRPKGPGLSFEFVRDLAPEDLRRAAEAPKGQSLAPLAQLRHRHHLLARLIAQSVPLVKVAAISGYTLARIQQLKNDPTFKELLAYYSEVTDEIDFAAQTRLRDLGIAAADELHERLEEKPKSFSQRELIELMTATLDRSGATPRPGQQAGGTSGPLTININFKKPSPSQDEPIFDTSAEVLPIDEP